MAAIRHLEPDTESAMRCGVTERDRLQPGEAVAEGGAAALAGAQIRLLEKIALFLIKLSTKIKSASMYLTA
jgi:hypothetical protein